MKGVDIFTVQKLMGHKMIQMTERYSHLAPQHQLEAVQRLCDTRSALARATGTRSGTKLRTVKHMQSAVRVTSSVLVT
jgi:hypothetical protein